MSDAAERRSEVPDGAVVAGLGAHTHDEQTLKVAVDVARRHGAPLHLLQCVNVASYAVGVVDGAAGEVMDLLESDVETELQGWAEQVRETAPDLAVTTGAPIGGPQAVLVEASERARLVVVGAGVREGSDPVLGTTPLGVAMHGHSPVLVVRGAGVPDGPVVVGIDDSANAAAALEAAALSAASRGVALRVLSCWWLEVHNGIVVTEPGSAGWQAVESRIQEMAERMLEPIRTAHPDVAVEVVVTRDQPHRALVEASKGASLVVVGSRGRGGFRGLLLGSVSHRVLRAAEGQVLVVRPSAYEAGEHA